MVSAGVLVGLLKLIVDYIQMFESVFCTFYWIALERRRRLQFELSDKNKANMPLTSIRDKTEEKITQWIPWFVAFSLRLKMQEYVHVTALPLIML